MVEITQRSITPYIAQALENKLVLLSGPRQVGKTTLSRQLFPESAAQYLNYDFAEDRRSLRSMDWSRQRDIVIFDELHKMPKWKSYIKGLYDKEGVRPRILVTGSARMDTFRKGGDSLAGRVRSFRLLPLSPAELSGVMSPEDVIARILQVGGFPEPFFSAQIDAYKLWRKSHLDRILLEDLTSLDSVRDVRRLEVLVDLLSERVGSTISYSSLARDLEISPHTVKRWISLLEALYVVFVVPPYSNSVARSLLKEPKIYFYDTGAVQNGEAARFENMVAGVLLKYLCFLEDTQGERTQLCYVRDREKREVDFATVINRKLQHLVEVKWAESNVSSSLIYYQKKLKPIEALQVVRLPIQEREVEGVRVVPAALWLPTLA